MSSVVGLHSSGFYSKLVRLKDLAWVFNKYRGSFLFQIGAIKSHFARSRSKRYSPFLFQIGAIKRIAAVNIRVNDLLFLFQIGAIKSDLKAVPEKWDTSVSIPNWCD